MTEPEGAPAEKRSTFREVELDLIVTRHDALADGVVLVTMADRARAELPAWTPGAHIDLMLGPSLVRQYSMCGRPKDACEWTVGVLRDPQSRGGSQYIHDELKVGDPIRVRGPRNHFPLISSPRYQFIAGGIGITPMIPMIEAAEARGIEWHLLYGGRSRQSMAFLSELSDYGDKVTVWPNDEHGLLDLAAILDPPRDDTLVYCCGPEPLLNAVEAACADWPDGRLQIERFAAKAVTDEQAAAELEHFEVVCARSGVTVSVARDVTIYDALEDVGIEVLASCLAGVCGTCEVPVLEGTPDHRDSVLTDEEQEDGSAIMICISRSYTERLVLDV